MERKPNNEEWKQRIKELEKEVVQLKLEKNELTSLKERLKILFEFAPDGYFLCDLKGRFIDGNKAAERLSGYKREELIGKSFLKVKLLASIEIKKADRVLAKIARGHPAGPEEFSLNRKDGSHVELEIRAFPVKIKGKTTVLAIARDITERKKADKALRESDQKFRSLFEHMAAASCFDEIVYEDGKPVDYRIIDVNPSYERIIGISKSAAAGALASKLYGTGEAPFLDVYSRVTETGQAASFEAYFPPSEKHLHIMVSCPGRGQFCTVFSDITERKRAERLLQESEKRYRTLFESSRDAIILINRKGKILQGNPAAIKMFGYVDNEEFTSQNVKDLSPDYQPDGTLSLVKAEQMNKIAQEKGSHFFEWKHKRKEGKEFFATVLLTKMELDNEIILQATVRDITENKLAEEALKKREKELEIRTNSLEKANTALGVLLRKREEDKKRLENGVLFNMRRKVEPYIEKLKNSMLDERQKVYVSILEKNLNDITSTFPQALSSKYLKLTPTELEVARLIKQGRSTKEIAMALEISSRTAEVHRENIRKKFNLKHRKDNLKTHLSSL